MSKVDDATEKVLAALKEAMPGRAHQNVDWDALYDEWWDYFYDMI